MNVNHKLFTVLILILGIQACDKIPFVRQSVEECIEKGDRSIASGNFEKAIEIYSRCRKNIKNSDEQYYEISSRIIFSYADYGVMLKNAGELEKAVEALEDGITFSEGLDEMILRNSLMEIYNALEFAYIENRRYDDAIDIINKADNILPDNIATKKTIYYGSLVVAYGLKGDLEMFAAYSKKLEDHIMFLKDFNPNHENIRKSEEMAGVYTNHVISESSVIGSEYYYKADFNNAIRNFKIGTSIYENNLTNIPLELDVLGWSYISLTNSYYYLGDYQLALESINKGNSIGIKEKFYFGFLGLIYSAKGQIAIANEAVDNLRLLGDDETADEIEAQIYGLAW